jgi:hypothetical protein
MMVLSVARGSAATADHTLGRIEERDGTAETVRGSRDQRTPSPGGSIRRDHERLGSGERSPITS